ncbi:MAG: hypothetical protein Q8O14_04955 [bacterium]|nr:hypothetical protein [bacterium]
MRHQIMISLMLALVLPGWGRLFVGLEDETLPVKSSDLAGFPAVTWTSHPAFEVNGLAAAPDGTIYACRGPFTTQIHRFRPDGPAEYLCNAGVDLHGLGYGNGTLYGFANFASPMGIYTIDPATGQAALAVDLSSPGYRYFALDFNPADGLLYGYTEYGSPSGLHSIDPTSGAITPIAGPIPAVNSQGRALAVGNGVVYLAATRGDDGVPLYAWDLVAGGPWTAFTQPFPDHHNTGGAAWLPAPAPRCEVEPGLIDLGVLLAGGLRSGSFTVTNAGSGMLTGAATADCPGLELDNNAYSLGPGESQTVVASYTGTAAGDLECLIDVGAECDPVICRAAVVWVAPLTGEASPCGTVDDLGHLPGAVTGFMVDWNAGDVGCNYSTAKGTPSAYPCGSMGRRCGTGPSPPPSGLRPRRESILPPWRRTSSCILKSRTARTSGTMEAGSAPGTWPSRTCPTPRDRRPSGWRLPSPIPSILAPPFAL